MFPALNYKTEWISVTTKQKILIMVSKEEQIELLVFQENRPQIPKTILSSNVTTCNR